MLDPSPHAGQSPEPPSPWDPLISLLRTPRFIVVTGKGGVGKTTVTATLARRLAAEGKRVLATEVASPTGGSAPLWTALTTGIPRPAGEVASAGPRIDHTLVTPLEGQRRFLIDVLPLAALADRLLASDALRRFLASAPAMTELGILYQGLHLVEPLQGAPRWDTVILDAPASGHALAMASLPEQMRQLIPGGPVGRSLARGVELLRDPRRTRVVLVTLPEPLPVTETLELHAGLRSQHLTVAGLCVNRIPTDPFDDDAHARLDRLFPADAMQEPQWGRLSVERLRRARQSLHRLQEAWSGPLVQLPEHEDAVPSSIPNTGHSRFMEGAR